MLTKFKIKNFKMLDQAEIELGTRVVFVGPNNSGKTTALQALNLWSLGVSKWIGRRGTGKGPAKRSGVTINRRELVLVPVPTANHLWTGKKTHSTTGDRRIGNTSQVSIELTAQGHHNGSSWEFGLQFYYANPEIFYCRPVVSSEEDLKVPAGAISTDVAYLPAMSGMSQSEPMLQPGAIEMILGQGRTAEVLRNLCFQVVMQDRGAENWLEISRRMKQLFGVLMGTPQFVPATGEIELSYKTQAGTLLDITSAGRGQQQTLLLLAHLSLRKNSVLLLDEPDSHLEVLRQRHIYQALSEVANLTNSQIIAASHSEVLLEEAADNDVVIAFVGKAHRVSDRGHQVKKALREVGFSDYLQAETTGWVLYLEGSTDLAMLKEFAKKLKHSALQWLELSFVHYVANQDQAAAKHFFALREAKPDLLAFALYDRLDSEVPERPGLTQKCLNKREIENYFCTPEVLLRWAYNDETASLGGLFKQSAVSKMEEAIKSIEDAARKFSKPDPWGPDIKASDDFLVPVFKEFFSRSGLKFSMGKGNFHTLIQYMEAEHIDSEIVQVLDNIELVAKQARPGE